MQIICGLQHLLVMNLKNRANIERVVSGNGSFYNPAPNKFGEFYLQVTGTPLNVKIKYDGNIDIIKNSIFSDNIIIQNNRNKNIITILSKIPTEYSEEKLFEFSGEIKELNYIKIYNWRGGSMYASIIDFVQTYNPLNKSKTNFEDDSIIIRDLPRKRGRRLIRNNKLSRGS